MSRHVGKDLLLPLHGKIVDGLELEVVQNRALVQGDATLEVVLVRIADICFCNKVEVISVTLRSDLSHQLERLLSLQNMNNLPCDYVEEPCLFVKRHSKIPGAYLSQRMNHLAFNFENLPHPILRMVNTHVSVNDNLMFESCSLNRESYCSLLRDLVVPKRVLLIIFKFYEEAQGSAIVGEELRRMKLCHLHRPLVSVPCAVHSSFRHDEEMTQVRVISCLEMLERMNQD
jgi:hypothetical protein